MDYSQYHNLDSYVFDRVRPHFIEQGYLSALDFFCIIIWKAERTKSMVAKRLLNKSKFNNLEAAVHELTTDLYQQTTAKDRLFYLWKEWEFRLPTASAILSILYPKDFTVYDGRVCDILRKHHKGEFHDLVNRSKFEHLWQGYEEFKRAVENTEDGTNLRDKDRYLWGESFHDQLTEAIENRFIKQDE